MAFNENDLYEKTIRKIYTFKGRIVNVRNDDAQLSDGRIVSREIVEHHGGVGVLPVTEDEQVYLVRQYRYAYETLLLEIPAGKLEPGEDRFHTGVRELHEEIGMKADTWYDLGLVYPSPGYCNEIISVYAATGLTNVGQCLDEGEYLNVVKVPLKQAVDMALSGELTDSKTVIALLKYVQLKEAGALVPMKTEAAE